MSETFAHPTEATTDTLRVLDVIRFMAVTTDPEQKVSIQQVADAAAVEYGITKKTLHTSECAYVERSGGPRESRTNPEPKTVSKTFDAVTEPADQGPIPLKCQECPYSNFKKRTLLRDRPTGGCIMLGTRRRLFGNIKE